MSDASSNKVPCEDCGVMILPTTASKYHGLCVPCSRGPKPPTITPGALVKEIRALEEIADARAVPRLIEILNIGNWDTTCRAASALVKIGDARAVAPLFGLFEKYEVRRDIYDYTKYLLKKSINDVDSDVLLEMAKLPKLIRMHAAGFYELHEFLEAIEVRTDILRWMAQSELYRRSRSN